MACSFGKSFMGGFAAGPLIVVTLGFDWAVTDRFLSDIWRQVQIMNMKYSALVSCGRGSSQSWSARRSHINDIFEFCHRSKMAGPGSPYYNPTSWDCRLSCGTQQPRMLLLSPMDKATGATIVMGAILWAGLGGAECGGWVVDSGNINS